jgi:phenylalanyl-tRNA synthetase beta chain
MNILIPHSWLLEHLETEAQPEEIQKLLSLAGPSVERIYEREGESVYDIEVTTNRVDAMSVRGIAREAAVILEQFGIPAKLKPLQLPTKDSIVPEVEAKPLPKVFNDPKLNKRTVCVVLLNVKRTPTPQWMAKRLKQIDVNVHDSVIDITNYVTHELGHPCHAFDYDKLMATGGEIHVVEAKKGETFITLDGNEFKTLGGEVVFKNGNNQIIDLPSIKGTKNTSIDETTKNVLFFTETTAPEKVRFASMSHAIRTTAAQLAEKGVDPNLAEPTIIKGTQLYQQLCDAHIASTIFDEFPADKKLAPIVISLKTIDTYLGLEIEPKQITTILENLGCVVSMMGNDRELELTVQPPTFRPDLTIPADIVEEIARIYGYHNLPSKIMDTAIPITKQDGVNFVIENKIKHFLSDIGWQEVYTYSLVSEELALQSGNSLEEHLKLQNPLTDDRVYLRRSLLPSLEEVLAENPQRSGLSVFEIANLYEPQDGQLPKETLHLTMVSTLNYRLVRGVLESLLEHFFVTNYTIVPSKKSVFLFTQGAEIKAAYKNGELIRIGKIGVLKSGHIGIGIAMSSFLEVVKTHPNYQPLSKTMQLTEDMTFQLPKTAVIGDVLALIKNSDSLVQTVTLKDVYQSNYTFTISYHHPETNVTGEQVVPIREKIVNQMTQQFNAKLIGKV